MKIDEVCALSHPHILYRRVRKSNMKKILDSYVPLPPPCSLRPLSTLNIARTMKRMKVFPMPNFPHRHVLLHRLFLRDPPPPQGHVHSPPLPCSHETCRTFNSSTTEASPPSNFIGGEQIIDAAPEPPAPPAPAVEPTASISSISFADQWEKAGMTDVLADPANIIPAVQLYEICEEPIPPHFFSQPCHS